MGPLSATPFPSPFSIRCNDPSSSTLSLPCLTKHCRTLCTSSGQSPASAAVCGNPHPPQPSIPAPHPILCSATTSAPASRPCANTPQAPYPSLHRVQQPTPAPATLCGSAVNPPHLAQRHHQRPNHPFHPTPCAPTPQAPYPFLHRIQEPRPRPRPTLCSATTSAPAVGLRRGSCAQQACAKPR